MGQGKAFKNKWLKKEEGKIIRMVPDVVDTTRNDLNQILHTHTHDADVLKELKKRRLIDKRLECSNG